MATPNPGAIQAVLRKRFSHELFEVSSSLFAERIFHLDSFIIRLLKGAFQTGTAPLAFGIQQFRAQVSQSHGRKSQPAFNDLDRERENEMTDAYAQQFPNWKFLIPTTRIGTRFKFLWEISFCH
jgi:hypothetical protein